MTAGVNLVVTVMPVMTRNRRRPPAADSARGRMRGEVFEVGVLELKFVIPA